jgi:hypothetical protein
MALELGDNVNDAEMNSVGLYKLSPVDPLPLYHRRCNCSFPLLPLPRLPLLLSALETAWFSDSSLLHLYEALSWVLKVCFHKNGSQLVPLYDPAPFLPGLSKPREYDSEEALLMKNKDWIMQFSDIGTDAEFEKVKTGALATFENFKKLEVGGCIRVESSCDPQLESAWFQHP